MRKLAVAVTVVALSMAMAAGLSPAYGQSTTPTSFQGGPDVSSDVTAPPVGQRDVPGGTGIADTDDDSSPVGWIVAAVVLVAAVAVIAAVAAKKKKARDDRDSGYRDVPSGV